MGRKKGSKVWKNNKENRDKIDKAMWWEPKGENSSIWY